MSRDYMLINNELFEIIKPRKYKPTIALHDCKTLYSCYARPSVYKANIYIEWLKWMCDINRKWDIDKGNCYISNFGISSYNAQTYTLAGDYYENGNFIGTIKITKAYNRIYIV